MKSDHDTALAALAHAADRLTESRWQANALVGVGVSAGYLGRFAQAHTALDRARELYAALGDLDRAATCLHNKGFIAAQAGEFTHALALYDAANLDDTKRPECLIDRANALLGAGIVKEAGRTLARAAAVLGAAGRGAAFAEATLAHARCALLTGDVDAAVKAAETAGDLFAAQDRPGWAARAKAVALRASGKASAAVANECERAGWSADAAELRLSAGLPDQVEHHRFSKTADLRGLGWLARSRLATTRRAVFAACHAGFRDEPRLRETGLTTAIAGGRPRTIFSWVERGRGDDVPPLAEITAALRDQVLVNLYVHNGRLGAISVRQGKFRKHDLGDARHVHDAADCLRLTSALATRTADHDAATTAAQTLNAVFRPLKLDDRPVVIVPPSGLASVPWAALPMFAGRPVAVVPSVSAWLSAVAGDGGDGPPVWIAGPGLDNAVREAADLHERHGGKLLHRESATVGHALAAMDGARLVHIATHGHHRPDRSWLDLADGPLYAHALGHIARPPRRLVLSSCESMRMELIDLLLRMGVGTVIASSLPVADDLAVDLMLAFHDRLAAGIGPAQALAEAQLAHGHQGFACYGSGV